MSISHQLRQDGVDGGTPPPPGLGFGRGVPPTASTSLPVPAPGKPSNSETAATAAAASLVAHFDRGLSLRSSGPEGFGGTTSAPPPPGFGASPDQRDGTLRLDVARDWLMQRQGSSASGGGSDGGIVYSGGAGGGRAGASGGAARGGGSGGGLVGTKISEDQIYQGSSALLRPSEFVAFDMGRPLSAPLDEDPASGEGRSTSYATLAAALGEELAESMNDSLQKQQQRQQQQHRQAATFLPEGTAAEARLSHHLPRLVTQTCIGGSGLLRIHVMCACCI